MRMKIQELQLTKDLKKVDPEPGMAGHNLKEILAKSGWHVLGYGAEAGVAEHPQKKYVLKIFPSNSLYKSWLAVVKALQSNDHVPRLLSSVRQIPGVPFNYVRMEKLAPVTTWDLIHEFPQTCCLIGKLMRMPPTWVKTNVSWHPETDLINCNQLHISPQEQQVFDKLEETAQTLGHRHLDLNYTNFMRRQQAWVLTDPFI